MANVYLTWQDVEELISRVVMQLNTPYDSLLLVTRGGIIPGGMIAEALKMKDVLTASVVFGQDSTLRAEMSWPRFQQFPAQELLQGKKILVVEYNEDNRHILVYRLRKIGDFDIIEATHGQEALDLELL